MGKVILALGALVSLALGGFLWKSTTRLEFPPSGDPMKIMNGTGEPGALQVVGGWEDRDAVRYLLNKTPPGVWRFIREGDELRVRSRSWTLPGLGERSLFQWEVRRGGELFYFNEPPAWRFWGLPALVAAAPLVLSCLVAGVLALVSNKKRG